MELDRVEAAVDDGDTDLGALGFWRLVRRVKRDPDLIERHADRIGRIDRKAFQAGVRIRIPTWAGDLLLTTVLAVGAMSFAVAASSAEGSLVTGIALVVAMGAWDVGVHSPTHRLVGRLVGIRFTEYFVRSIAAPPGVKTDYTSYLRASPSARAWMHASGALASKVVPFLVIVLASVFDVDAPAWAIAIVWVVGVGQIFTDAIFSTRRSDWKKVRRELAVARDLRRPAGARATLS